MRRFLLESGLHKLAYWLRLLGIDALILEGEVNKREVLKHPDRVFITTSRKLEEHLRAWGIEYLVLPKEDWKIQLCLLLRYFNIEPELRLNRCYYC
ncbi:MAG: Mut7-C RNAse domain-containing protein, partial [Aquificaceae bacterium]